MAGIKAAIAASHQVAEQCLETIDSKTEPPMSKEQAREVLEYIIDGCQSRIECLDEGNRGRRSYLITGEIHMDLYGMANELSVARAEIERLRAEIADWKRTALAMRDEATRWAIDGKPRHHEIQKLYLDAAVFQQFVSAALEQGAREVK